MILTDEHILSLKFNTGHNDDHDWFNERLADGGPLYAETDFSRWIVEPWNAATSLLMMLPAVYWFFRSVKSQNYNRFLIFCLILVFLGGLGSTLFHAFRQSRFFLLLDIVPSAVLTLSLSIWFWIKSFRNRWSLVFFILGVMLLRFTMFRYLPQHQAINLSYLLTGITVLAPLFIYLSRCRFAGWKDILLTVLFFAMALFFRETDTTPVKWLPVGTHFLWHVFSAAGSFFMMKYLYARTMSSLNPESVP